MAKRFDISPNVAFWGVCSVLLACAVFFAISVEYRRGTWSTLTGEDVKNGMQLTLHRVIDGDEVAMRTVDGETFVVRLLGIKCFEPSGTEVGIAAAGQQCMRALETLLKDDGSTASLAFTGNVLRDSRERVLAYLEKNGQDIGRALVHEGHAMVFVRYPFDREGDYLADQVTAKNESKGLWGHPKARARAEALLASWTAERSK